MNTNKQEVFKMTNKQVAMLIEAIKIIVDQAKDKAEIKNALDKLQSVFERSPQ